MPAQRAALAAVSVIVAVVCLLASSHPTGVSWLDGLYRVALGVTVVLAGSRARRWALIVGSAVVAVGSLGASLLFGLLGLVLALVLVGRDRRDRVYGGVIGGLVVISAFHLSISIFFGSASLVGAVAVGSILLSGYRASSRIVRRRWRLVIRISLGVGLAAVVIAVGVAIVSASELQHGITETQAGVSAAQNGQESAASDHFTAAARDLSAVSDRSNAWWMSLARAVPILSQNVAAVQRVSDSGTRLTTAAADIAQKVDYNRLRLPAGGIDTKLLASFRAPVLTTAATLARADATVSSAVSPWNVGPLQDRLATFRSKIDGLRRQAALAALAVDRVPAMLGVGAPRHYLVLLGDPAEARDLGGHLGNWAELNADNGQLTLARVGVPADLSLANDPGASALLTGVPPSLTAMKPLNYPQNWGADPDMSVVEHLSATLFERKTGDHIDGVLYADPTAFADFVAITGPVPVPGLASPITATNAVQFLTSGQFTDFPTEAASNAATTQLVHDMFDRLTKVELPGPKQLSALFYPAVSQGRFKMASSESSDGELLAALGLDGAITIPAGGDVLGIINRNANPSKIDAYLHRSTTVDVEWNPATGRVTETVDVTLHNAAPASGLPATVIGNGAGLPAGTNLTDLALLTGYQLQRVEIDGHPASSHPLFDGSYWRQSVRVQLSTGQTSVVRYQLSGFLPPAKVYRVFVVGQPIVNSGRLVIHVHAAAGRVVPGHGMTSAGSSAVVRLGDGVDTSVAVRVGTGT